jgi:DNA-binding response OmpR family regulator
VIKGDRPDLVLLDVKMPDVSGVDVCTALKADLTPVILISAGADRENRLAGLKVMA